MNLQRTSMIKLVKMGFAMAILMVAGESALAAGTAANAILQNTAQVDYNNTAGNNAQSATATSTITVNLVQAAPLVAFNDPTTTADLANLSEGQSISVFYDVTSNANGPDSYDIATVDTATSNYTTSAFTYPDNSFSLGATSVSEAFDVLNTAGAGAGECTTAGTGTCEISVPNDTAASGSADSIVNGIAAGDRVVLNNGTTIACDVVSVTDTLGVTQPTNFSTIEVNNCTDSGGTFSLAIGSDIFERQTIQINVVVGNLGGAGDGSSTLSTTAATTTNGGANTSTADTNAVLTIKDAAVAIYKFVRNTTTPNAGDVTDPGDSSITVVTYNDGGGDQTYYKSGVTADPADVLEYLVLIQHEAGNVTQLVIQDTPGIFTSYVANSIEVMDSGTIACTPDSWICDVDEFGSTISTATDATDGDRGRSDGSTLFIYGGSGAAAADNAAGGTISSGITLGTYRVEVAN